MTDLPSGDFQFGQDGKKDELRDGQPITGYTRDDTQANQPPAPNYPKAPPFGMPHPNWSPQPACNLKNGIGLTAGPAPPGCLLGPQPYAQVAALPPNAGFIGNSLGPMSATGDGLPINPNILARGIPNKDIGVVNTISDVKQMDNYIGQLKAANILPTGCGECYYVVPNYMSNGIQCISVNVSPAGLLTVFLANDISVEMTLDHTVRLVNHRHHSVGAATALGDLSCVCHCSGQMYNEGTTTEVMLVYDRKIKMAPNDYLFSSASEVYSVRDHKLSIGDPEFRDLHSDMTITLLYSSGGYGPHLALQLASIARQTAHMTDMMGVVTLRVNGVVIQQRPDGDVVVRYGDNFLRSSATNGAIRVDTTMAEMAIDGSWVAQVYREDCKMRAALDTLALSDDTYEFGFMPNRKVYLRPIAAVTETIIMNGNRVDEACTKDPILSCGNKSNLGLSGSDTIIYGAIPNSPPRIYGRRRNGRFTNSNAPLGDGPETAADADINGAGAPPPRFKKFEQGNSFAWNEEWKNEEESSETVQEANANEST